MTSESPICRWRLSKQYARRSSNLYFASIHIGIHLIDTSRFIIVIRTGDVFHFAKLVNYMQSSQCAISNFGGCKTRDKPPKKTMPCSMRAPLAECPNSKLEELS